jgi:hypothetical protein
MKKSQAFLCSITFGYVHSLKGDRYMIQLKTGVYNYENKFAKTTTDFIALFETLNEKYVIVNIEEFFENFDSTMFKDSDIFEEYIRLKYF